MHRIGPGLPPELKPIDDKAQGGIDAITAIIEFLISESSNPEETKTKLNKLLSKYGSSRTLSHFGSRAANLMK
ncbi:hypothetical protein [Photorhabdus luminescens]|uniref:hypothetical protein n=1 Tax=Photorhabdus luminescens TaxID=29488 RepID=UPI00223F7A2D|nr:hypothetical protein [Photorhabdus luminescens]MCW7764319.1 hypothetical protein [Photorhabdus luminescens subsp. venezuelensis]